MARAEKAPTYEDDLTTADRRDLNTRLSSFLIKDRLAILMDQRLEDQTSFILLNRLMQLRQTEEVGPSQRNQLGRMVALGVKQMPAELPWNVINAEPFLELLIEEIPEELEAVAKFPESHKNLPSPWNKALADWRKADRTLLGKK